MANPIVVFSLRPKTPQSFNSGKFFTAPKTRRRTPAAVVKDCP
jgi:hypothetical protein